MTNIQRVYVFKLSRGKVYIVLLGGFHNPKKGFWEVSRSTHKKTYYFRSLDAAKIFVELNFGCSCKD